MTFAARTSFKLTAKESDRLHKLNNAARPMEGDAWKFWKQVAASRGLDPGSLIHVPETGATHGLPEGHGV